MKISPQLRIRKITADARGGPEVIRTFPVMKIQICSTERSRSRRRHGLSDEYWTNFGRPVTEAMTEMAGNYANISRDKCSDLFDQLVRESMTAWAGSNEPLVEQLSGCRIPGCQCEGRIKYMEWGSEDMTETDDSEYEDPDDRTNRLYVESCNYDLSEGMTPKTYTPPLRKNRRRRYEVRKNNGSDIKESISGTSDQGFQTDEGSPNRNRQYNRGRLLMIS